MLYPKSRLSPLNFLTTKILFSLFCLYIKIFYSFSFFPFYFVLSYFIFSFFVARLVLFIDMTQESVLSFHIGCWTQLTARVCLRVYARKAIIYGLKSFVLFNYYIFFFFFSFFHAIYCSSIGFVNIRSLPTHLYVEMRKAFIHIGLKFHTIAHTKCNLESKIVRMFVLCLSFK